MSVNEKMTTIANKIRSYTKETDRLSLDEIPTKIDRCRDIGFENGVLKGEEDGRYAQYKEFWNSYLSGLSNYGQAKRAFGSRGWNNKTFKPPIGTTLNPVNAELYFAEANITDLRGILKERNVTLDLSKMQYCAQFAYYSTITNFPVIDMTSVTNRTSMFEGCSKMVTIEKLNFGNKTTANTSMFNGCTALKNIVIEGVIATTISFSSSPLTKDSITSIVNALSTTATGKTLTLKKTAVNEAFGIDVDDETTYPEGSKFYELRHSKDNWTFSYA
ncbi:MAG: hypothetical protein IJC10_00155 [Clostridia bacterium]|nr:hypothetical protein [Clostridia bacterium]